MVQKNYQGFFDMRKISYFLAVALGIFLLLSLIGVSQIWDGWTDEISKNYEYASEQSAVFGKVGPAGLVFGELPQAALPKAVPCMPNSRSVRVEQPFRACRTAASVCAEKR